MRIGVDMSGGIFLLLPVERSVVFFDVVAAANGFYVIVGSCRFLKFWRLDDDLSHYVNE